MTQPLTLGNSFHHHMLSWTVLARIEAQTVTHPSTHPPWTVDCGLKEQYINDHSQKLG